MTNAALIAKLEQAQEGSRARSDEVLLALGNKRGPYMRHITTVYRTA